MDPMDNNALDQSKGSLLGRGLKGLALDPFRAYNSSFQLASGNVSMRNAPKAMLSGVSAMTMGTGAAVGANLGHKWSGGDGQATAQGALIGAGIGAAAPALAGVATAGIGAGAIFALKNTDNVLANIGTGMFGAAKYGTGAASALIRPLGRFNRTDTNAIRNDGKSFGRTRAALGHTSNGLKRTAFYMGNPLQKYGQIGSSVAGSLFKYKQGEYKVNRKGEMKYTPGRLRLGKLGIAAGIVGMVGASGSSALSSYHDRQGQSAGVVNATPRPYSFENNGGASGDLVFALHNNR